MFGLDWENPEDYQFTHNLNPGQWAWEFLRRNSAYQQDWVWFDRTWKTLESRYGKPPNRDYQAWQHDPDAYRIVDDRAGDCRVDSDKVLIECWMGAKWGFYKFPLSPETHQPQIGEQLSWRELEETVTVVDEPDSDYISGDLRYIALGFDLDLPLRRQLDEAKAHLQRRQARLRRSGRLSLRSVAELGSRWTVMLRLLDGIQTGGAAQVLPAELQDLADQQGGREHLLLEADNLLEGGYRQLAFLPEGVKTA